MNAIDHPPIEQTDWKQALTPTQLKALQAMGTGPLVFISKQFRQRGGFHCSFKTLEILRDYGLATHFKEKDQTGFWIQPRGCEVLLHLRELEQATLAPKPQTIKQGELA